jgi:hypothetical protein
VSDVLRTDEEAELLRELRMAAALLAHTANELVAVPPTALDVEAAREALVRVPAIVTRLRARGSREARADVYKELTAVEGLVGGPLSSNLVKTLVARTPVPGGPPLDGQGPTAIDIAELYRAASDWLIRHDPRHPAIAGLQRGLRPILEQTKAYAEAAENEMESPDHPDLAGIAANVLRLDVLTWLLLTAGFPRDAIEIQARTRRLARSALRRATLVMNRCATTFALADRIDLAGTLSEIDDLVLIFQRVREGEREEMPEGEETFTQSLGAQVIGDFTGAMNALAYGIMDSFIAGTLDVADDARAGEVAGMLRALGKLRRLLIGVKDEGTVAAVEWMTKEINIGLLRIGRHITHSIERATAEQDRKRLSQIEVIGQAFIILGKEMNAGA